ncbi:hypothetical protein EDD18DRAFT_1346680 [Armillaria luteobubalina]|uniref:Uncharacterized protein n=1 Tax=Armillaria luteobubalina TaxID=153913 RepID=A0AA39QFR8_9AGAR|nr:hypothetical protein EDD18DRAFT_1346680 [Armillaria luteobubalina]
MSGELSHETPEWQYQEQSCMYLNCWAWPHVHMLQTSKTVNYGVPPVIYNGTGIGAWAHLVFLVKG